MGHGWGMRWNTMGCTGMRHAAYRGAGGEVCGARAAGRCLRSHEDDERSDRLLSSGF